MQYTAFMEREGKKTTIEFPGLEGCATFADIDEDVAEVAREALESWLEAELIQGVAPPQPAAVSRPPRGASIFPVEVPAQLAARLKIRWAREEAGVSQGELARRMHISRQQISKIETTGGNVTIETLDRIAKALGADLDFEIRRKAAAG